MKKDSPIRFIRERLLKDSISKSKLNQYDKLALVIKAWNFHRSGNVIKVLKFDRNTENFPKPI